MYQAPGVYASFVKTAGAAVNAGRSRTLALVGTGINYYNVINETVRRNSDRPYDTLAHENVFELQVSSGPIYSTRNNPETTIYKPTIYSYDSYGQKNGIKQQGDYELIDGKYIAWRTLDEGVVKPYLQIVDTDPYINEGSRMFENQCTYDVDLENKHFIVDGTWRIEVTYASQFDGCYRIVNNDTNELIGEYVAEAGVINTAIPGCKLIIPSTYKKPHDSTNEEDNMIAAGDYFILVTEACKTEIEATATVASGSNPYLSQAIKTPNIINPSKIIDAQYKIVVVDGDAHGFQVTKVEDTEILLYPNPSVESEYATWISGNEIYDIIPGVEIILKDFPSGYSPQTGDVIYIETKQRIIKINASDDEENVIPGEGDTYYVSYKYRKSDEGYEAQYFTDYDNIVDRYGAYEVTASGVVKNSLSLGAEIAFTNGASQLICVQAKGDTDAEFCAAIDRLRKQLPSVENVSTIVPLTKSEVVGAYCANHVNVMSSYDYSKERMCYLGAFPKQPMSKYPSGSDRSLGIIETCTGYLNERVVYVVPGEVIKSIRDPYTGRSTDRPLPGCYLAVAVATLGLGDDPAEPITNKAISGFSYLPNRYSEAELNLMASNGACVVFMRGNNLIVRHAVTTDPGDVNSFEITCVQIKDYVIDAVRSGCRQYIGRKNTTAAVGDIEYTISSILSQFVSRVIIESYQNLKVTRSATDPRAINVSFEILPIYSLTYINISFSFTQQSA